MGEEAGGWVGAEWEDSKSFHDDSVFLLGWKAMSLARRRLNEVLRGTGLRERENKWIKRV